MQVSCFICHREFKNMQGLITHLNRFKEAKHIEYKNHINLCKKTYNIENYQEIHCSQGKCENCPLFEKCLYLEKQLFIKLKAEKEKSEKSDKEKKVSLGKQLLSEFYSFTHVPSPNFRLDLIKINKFLNSGISVECIRDAFKILIAKGYKTLQYLSNYTIAEAIQQQEIKSQLNDPNSLASLIQNYYFEVNSNSTSSILYKDVLQFQSLVDSYNLNLEQIQYTIQYMIKHNIFPFRFISGKMPLILKEFNDNKKRKIADKKFIEEDSYLESALIDLSNAKATYFDTIQIYGEKYNFKDKVFSLLKDHKFNKQYSAIEWLYRIQLPLTKDFYFLAKEITKTQNKLCHFDNENDTIKFKSWLKDYKCRFEL